MSQNDLCDIVITMYALFLLLKTCGFPTIDFKFGMAGLNLGRWAEKEQAWRKFTWPLEKNFKSK